MHEQDPVFRPIQIGPKKLKNRFAIQAMEACDADIDGNPTEKTYRRYRRYMEGRAGLVDLEAITVTDQTIARKFQLRALPRNRKSLEKLTLEMKSVNPDAVFIWQLTHSGELSNPKFSKRVCTKPMPGFGGEMLSEEDVEKIIDEFVLSAKIAHDCGADGVDFKNCHGYLGSQFVRPYNDRKWKYGGSFENRTRFTYTVYERIAKEITDPNFLIGSKISFWEGFPGGQGTAGPRSPVLDISEPIALAKGMEERGASFIIVSAGSPSLTLALTQPDKAIPDYVYLHFSFQKAAREALKKETVVIGSGYSVLGNGKNALQTLEPEEKTLLFWANKNIDEGLTDMVAFGRQSFADPLVPVKLLEGREEEIKWCVACDNCVELLIRQANCGCTTFDKEYTEILRETRKREGKLTFKRT